MTLEADPNISVVLLDMMSWQEKCGRLPPAMSQSIFFAKVHIETLNKFH